METRAAYVAVGAFVLALIIGVVFSVLWLARGQFTQRFTRYDIYFASVATGLVEGSPVRISGVQVGRVISVALDPDNPQRVRVTVEVTSNAPIRSDSVGSIEVTALTGGAAVEITPGSKDAPPIEIREGQRYAIIWSRESNLQQVVANVPQLLAKLTDLTDKLSGLFSEKNQAAVAATLDNLSHVTAAAAAHSNEIEQILANGASSSKDLRRAVVSLQDTMKQMQETLRQFDGVAGDARNALHDVDTMVKENRAPLRQFTENGLDEFRQLVTQTQDLVTAMTRAVDALDRDPSRLLYGNRRQGYKPQ